MDSCPASLSGKKCFIKSSRFKRIDKAVLGRGSYGVVYEGKYGAKDCALKYMYDYFFRESPDASQFKLEEFERECELTRRLSDPHIVQFVGVSFHENVPVLITELLECSLDDVTKCKHCSVPYDKEIDIAVGIAKGLLYLHTHNPPVFHRDLSSKNILLASDYTPKIADLGLAKCIKESSGFTKTAGTPDFMPPEIMETTTPWRLSGAIDLYSYAVVLIQLATRQVLNRLPKIDLVIEGGPAEPSKEEKEKDANDDDENKQDRDAERETEKQNFKGEEKAEEERDAGEESEDETLRYHSRTEYERWRVHIDHMNKDGILHRIVKCYLKDDPRRREATPLSRVIVWLEEETHSAEYLVEHSSENPGVCYVIMMSLLICSKESTSSSYLGGSCSLLLSLLPSLLPSFLFLIINWGT